MILLIENNLSIGFPICDFIDWLRRDIEHKQHLFKMRQYSTYLKTQNIKERVQVSRNIILATIMGYI